MRRVVRRHEHEVKFVDGVRRYPPPVSGDLAIAIREKMHESVRQCRAA